MTMIAETVAIDHLTKGKQMNIEQERSKNLALRDTLRE